MTAPIIHVLPLTTITRERHLPVPGRVTAQLDRKVTALDVVAEALHGDNHLLLDVAKTFGIQAKDVEHLLQVRVGDKVSANEILARQSGLGMHVIRAPMDGRVVLMSNGYVVLETGDPTFELRAGMPGIITRVISERGVEITFTGALVQGVWGNNQVDLGMMLPVLANPGETLTIQQIDVSQRGSILFAGRCQDARVLQAAAELPVRGMILGSLSPSLLSQALQVRFPIIVLDGFAFNPINKIAYKLLMTNAKREVTLNAVPLDLHNNIHPEIYIPLPVNQYPPAPMEVVEFSPDQPVRLTRAPHPGEIGRIIEVHHSLTTIPNGLRVPTAKVKLDSGEHVIVPLSNLEVMG